jgi:hypothetical protein
MRGPTGLLPNGPSNISTGADPMPQAEITFAPSRRQALGLGAVAFATISKPASSTPCPDAELIRLCGG